MELREIIADALIKAIRTIPSEVEEKLYIANETEVGINGKRVLNAIISNLDASKESGLPLCQDTGMFWVLVQVGRESSWNIVELEKEINAGLAEASFSGYYRKSVVSDPIYNRINTKDNLPAVINYELIDGKDTVIKFLLKGFGSENCSSVRMLNPTSGEKGVIEAVKDIVKKAGGKPCPPMFLGIGVGGTFDRSALLSKKAFFKAGDNTELENKLIKELNENGVGPGGLGGINTVLDVRILTEPTHIAGLPVSVTINCWCDRKVEVVVKGGQYES